MVTEPATEAPPLPARAPVHRQRGRALVVAAVALYFVVLAGVGWVDHWDRLGVPASGFPSFFDLRSVTSGWDCARRGISVLAANPCDPARRPANYPQIWMAPSHLGLGESSTVPLGIAIAIVFLVAAIAVVPREATLGQAVLYAALVCSPATMLGVERGNVDILLFALLVAAVLARERWRGTLRPALVLFAAILKLFPIFAVGIVARQRPRDRARVLLGAVLVLFGAYVVATLSDIRTIRRVTPQGDGYSYGVRLLGDWLGTTTAGLSPHAWDLLLLAAGVAVAAGVGLAWRSAHEEPETPGSERDLDFFWAGAGVYVATYALTRSFDYRLVFALMTVPWLLRVAARGRVRAVAIVLALVGTFWLGTPWVGNRPIGHAYTWVQAGISAHAPFHVGYPELGAFPQFPLFVVLLAGLVATAPLERLGLARSPRLAAEA